MYEELEILEEIGLGTSKEIQEILDIHIRNVIKHLSRLEERQEISVIIFKTPNHRKKVYMKNEIYNSISKIK